MTVRTVHRRRASSPAAMKRAEHLLFWRIVEGAVVDAFNSHPDYLTPRGRRSAVESVTKRVVGGLIGYANETRKGGRFGGS